MITHTVQKANRYPLWITPGTYHNIIFLNLHYELNKNQGLKDIFKILKEGSNVKKDVSITFVEGKNMRYYAKIIAKNTNYSEEDIFNKLKDKEYIKSLINTYWFLTEDILDEDIYKNIWADDSSDGGTEGSTGEHMMDDIENITLKINWYNLR